MKKIYRLILFWSITVIIAAYLIIRGVYTVINISNNPSILDILFLIIGGISIIIVFFVLLFIFITLIRYILGYIIYFYYRYVELLDKETSREKSGLDDIL